MATIAEFSVPATTFPVGDLFDDFPEVSVELERVVPTSQAIIPYFWIRGASGAAVREIEQAFHEHPEVTSIDVVDEVDGEYLTRVDWKHDYQGVLKAIVETDVVLISGSGKGDRWKFEIRSDSRAGVANFQRYCLEHGIPIEVTGLHALAKLRSGTEFDLTDAQREALVLAYERGYFDSPRAVTLAEIAGELEITAQSLGSRLRRGNKRLIRNTLVEL